ncbi:MAG: hypothetical protein M3O71_13685 [Bacteroidota bacterium]|nr:hypothetical protein [Bacteroidota bacterium]
MKKAAVLCITAFYLLLTTGMFVCMVHCAAENLVKEPAMQMTKSMHHDGKGCAEKKNCDCCKKHGNFVIKENLKPATDIQYAQAAIVIPRFEIAGFILSTPVIQNSSWHESNAPPNRSGKTIIIQNQSFLI